MTYGPRRIPWASEAREEAWLEWAGQQAKEAIREALGKEWTVEEMFNALGHLSVNRFDYIVDLDTAAAVALHLTAAIAFLGSLDPEDAIRVCDKMGLPGEWEYSDDWDPRSL